MKRLIVAFAALALVSCAMEPEEKPEEGRIVPVKVLPMVETYGNEPTKSSLNADEQILDVWSVAAYYKGWFADYANSTDKPYMELPAGKTYSFFAIANTPSAETFFLDYMGEGTLYNALETFPEEEYYPGCLPMSYQASHYVAEGDQTVPIVFRRLVAKYNVRVNRNFSDPCASFVVTGMRLRSSPRLIRPFQVQGTSFAISALSSVEVSDAMDSASPEDIASLNAGGTASLYTLENLQGKISNSDPWSKNTSQPATWLELTGEWQTAGASAEIVYRMYLGSNSTDDFNVERNTSYDLSLNLSEAGFGHLDSSWKIARTAFEDNRSVHIEGDWMSDCIMVYDDGEPVQYIIDKNIEDVNLVVSLEVMDDAGISFVRNGDVVELTTSLRGCLSMPQDELVVTTFDGAVLRRVPVVVLHRLDFADYDLGGEADDPQDVTVGQRLIFSIENMDEFESAGYPLSGLGFRFGKYSTQTSLPPHYFDVQDVNIGPGVVELECWAMEEPGDLLYLEVFDRNSGNALTRDGVFLVQRPSLRWVEWTGTGGFSQTAPLSGLSLTLGGGTRTVLLQYVSPRGSRVEFNQEQLQELDLEPDLTSLNNRYLTIEPVFTTSYGDVNYPRQVYNISVGNPHSRPRTIGSFITQYYTGLRPSSFEMPPLTAFAPNAHAPVSLPVDLSLMPVDISVRWSGGNLVFDIDCSRSGEMKIRKVTQSSSLHFSVSDAYRRLTSGMLSKDELFDEAVTYTYEHRLTDTGYIVSYGISDNNPDLFEFRYGYNTTVLGETSTGSYSGRYTCRIQGSGSEGCNLWLDNTDMLPVTMTFGQHRVDLEMNTSFPELFFPIRLSERVPFNVVSCPPDVALSIDGKLIE